MQTTTALTAGKLNAVNKIIDVFHSDILPRPNLILLQPIERTSTCARIDDDQRTAVVSTQVCKFTVL